MNANIIQTEPQLTCYLCGHVGTILYQDLKDRIHGVPGDWSFRCCTNTRCEFIWLDPMPKAEDIWKLYQTYHTHNLNEEESSLAPPSYLASPLKRNMLGVHFGYKDMLGNLWMQSLARVLGISPGKRERIGRTFLWARGEWRGRVLDIGCGNGKLLYTLRQLGWDCTGFEPDPVAAAVAKNHYKLKIYENNLSDISLKEKPFDLITSSHVIEHLLDPVENLKIYSQLLRPGGKIIIATPNVESLASHCFKKSWYALDPPRHLYLFTKRTLGQCLKQAGLEIDSIHTNSACFKTIWRRSKIIKQHHLINPGAFKGRQSLLESLTTRIFGTLEQFSVPFNTGEELIAIATKRN